MGNSQEFPGKSSWPLIVKGTRIIYNIYIYTYIYIYIYLFNHVLGAKHWSPAGPDKCWKPIQATPQWRNFYIEENHVHPILAHNKIRAKNHHFPITLILKNHEKPAFFPVKSPFSHHGSSPAVSQFSAWNSRCLRSTPAGIRWFRVDDSFGLAIHWVGCEILFITTIFVT